MPSAPAPLEIVHGAEQAAFLLEPTRRRLLAELAEPASAAGLARRLGLPRQRLAYHLRELERGGWVECVEERRRGNCTERLVRATARAFVLSPAALGLLGDEPQRAADRASAAFLAAVAARTLAEVGALDTRARAEKKRVATLALDGEVRFASAAARAAFADELAALFARLLAKYHDADARGGRSFRVVAAVHPKPPTPAPEPVSAGGDT